MSLQLCKQGNRHPRARRTGLVPAGVNHRALDRAYPSARLAAPQPFGPSAHTIFDHNKIWLIFSSSSIIGSMKIP